MQGVVDSLFKQERSHALKVDVRRAKVRSAGHLLNVAHVQMTQLPSVSVGEIQTLRSGDRDLR